MKVRIDGKEVQLKLEPSQLVDGYSCWINNYRTSENVFVDGELEEGGDYKLYTLGEEDAIVHRTLVLAKDQPQIEGMVATEVPVCCFM